MSDKIIELKNVYYTYDKDDEKTEKSYALKDISFSIEKGSFVSIIGHNGSGKSTLAKIMSMIVTPTSGQVYLFGKQITNDISEDDFYELRKRVGIVFQNPDNQLVATIVEEDVAFGPENIGVPSEEIRTRVDNALAITNMSSYSKHSVTQLSGGQKQRVAIAGILALNPEIIVFDESTAMLDPIGREEVLSVIDSLKNLGATIIFITHHMNEAAKADKIIVLNDGEIYLSGSPKEIYNKEDEMRRIGLDIPQAKLVLDIIKDNGFDVDNSFLNEKDAAMEISRLLGGPKNG